MRGFFYRFFMKKAGRSLCVGQNTILLNLEYLTVGDNCFIDDNVFINAKARAGIVLGDNVNINRNCVLHGFGERNGAGIIIGDNVTIGNSSFIYGHALVEIGNYCAIGQNVIIIPENHNYINKSILIRKQGCTRKSITIKDDVWIGSHVVILAGVTINKGAVVAAGAVVSKDVPENAVAAGVPAKIIKYRK